MVTFKDGKIVLQSKYFEQAKYDMSNETVAVQADGCGGLTSYRVANRAGNALSGFLSLDLSVGGKRLSPYISKTVEMIGRMQKVILQTPQGELSVTTFLGGRENGVFFLLQGEGLRFDLALNCRDAKSPTQENVVFVEGQNFCLSTSVTGDWVAENDCFYLSAREEVKLFFSFGASSEEHRAAFMDFDGAFSRCLAEIKAVKIPSSVRTEEEKALYYAAYFTALQNHKTIGDFKAFAAGINYLEPLRTYYRDSYFTVLPMLGTHPELVRDEILTLARGVGADGACPSAVKSDFTSFWGDHYDSPSFFVMEVYDYVCETGDRALLNAKVGGATIADKIKAVLARLATATDQTGLIVKEGAYNKRDWADEVNRTGYVTFVEALYYRALQAAATLFEGEPCAKQYRAQAERVKEATNALLFDKEEGYYVNYKSAEGVEDNLSVDTVFAVLFGVADKEQSVRVLDRMEHLLETKNNPDMGGEDFGVACVYPPYSLPRSTCNKSSHLYEYHNGANWCYLTAMYAYAKSLFGRDWRAPLVSTFRYMLTKKHYTLIEYFSPCCKAGSVLQAWSAAIAFAFERAGEEFFK